MATQSLATKPAFYLSQADAEEIGYLCAQARGIAACIGVASNASDQIPADALPNAAWALQNMIDRVHDIATSRRGGAA